jgi:hypothetical protein
MAAQGGRRPGAGQKVVELYETFEQLRRRHLRLTRAKVRKELEADELRTASRRRVSIAVARDRVGYHAAWSRWSDSYDEVASAADRLVRCRPQSLAELVLVLKALEWSLLTDAIIVDRVAEDQVRRFGQRLRQLAGRQ